MTEAIGGTVIQRSFVGREATNVVHIATVPVAELGFSESEPLHLLAETLGIPRNSILDLDDYEKVLSALRGIPPDYLLPYWDHPRFLRRYWHRLEESLYGEDERERRFSDFINVAGDTSSSIAPLFSPLILFPQDDLPLPENLSPQAMTAALHCFAARAGRTPQSEAFVGDLYHYDVPLGQSPEVKSDSLLKLLETSNKICLAPLAIGGVHAVSQLTQGAYVAALLTTGTAGAMTLVLIGTVSVGALIVQRVAQARARSSDGGNSPATPKSSSTRGRSGSGRAGA